MDALRVGCRALWGEKQASWKMPEESRSIAGGENTAWVAQT